MKTYILMVFLSQTLNTSGPWYSGSQKCAGNKKRKKYDIL